jgi:hypothetical protein
MNIYARYNGIPAPSGRLLYVSQLLTYGNDWLQLWCVRTNTADTFPRVCSDYLIYGTLRVVLSVCLQANSSAISWPFKPNR